MSKFNHSAALKSIASAKLEQMRKLASELSADFAKEKFSECSEFYAKLEKRIASYRAWYASESELKELKKAQLRAQLAELEKAK